MQPSTPAALRLLTEGSATLARIEANGMAIDEAYLDRQLTKVKARVEELTAAIRHDPLFHQWQYKFGKQTKICPDQIARLVFDDPADRGLGYAYDGERTPKKGSPKGTAESLGKVDLPIVRNYLQLVRLQKVKSTYLDGIKREVVDGYLHAVYNTHLARTFRLSCSEPNAQNFPRRNPLAEKIVRRCFIPRHPGWQIYEVDYSGIEVRVGCCLHQDSTMIRYLQGQGDMHADAACRLFFLKPGEVDKKTHRDAGKNGMVFPMFYGQFWGQVASAVWKTMEARNFKGPGGVPLPEHLARHGITELGFCGGKKDKDGKEEGPRRDPEPGTFAAHVKDLQEWLWKEQFPGYARWKWDAWEAYLSEGGFMTMTGFYCNALSGKKGLLVKNDVTNYPIQGPSAHCMVWAINRVEPWLRKNLFKTVMMATIHDSVVFDGPPSERDDVLAKVKEVTTVDLPKAWPWARVVPMEVDAEAAPPGRSWYEKEKCKL